MTTIQAPNIRLNYGWAAATGTVDIGEEYIN